MIDTVIGRRAAMFVVAAVVLAGCADDGGTDAAPVDPAALADSVQIDA